MSEDVDIAAAAALARKLDEDRTRPGVLCLPCGTCGCPPEVFGLDCAECQKRRAHPYWQESYRLGG